jgi:hypothetical protein
MNHQHTLEERRKFLNCDGETDRYLKEFRSLLAPEMDRALDHFYAKVMSTPELSRLFTDKEALRAARNAQRHHLLDVLFGQDLGHSHMESSIRIGTAHEQMGLSIGWYLNGYCLMINRFVRIAADRHQNDAIKLTRMIQEINKVAFLDMHYVVESYLSAKDRALKRVLSDAEAFVAEIRDRDDSLEAEALKLREQLAHVAARLEPRTNDGDRAIRHDIEEAVKEADHLAARIESLKHDLDVMQRQHKLQFVPARKRRLVDTIKSWFGG